MKKLCLFAWFTISFLVLFFTNEIPKIAYFTTWFAVIVFMIFDMKIVNCKDCKHFIPGSELDHEQCPNHIGADGYCDNCLRYTNKTEFCSGGRRK